MAAQIKEEYLNNNTLIRRYAIDEATGDKYNLIQHPTGFVYREAIDPVSNPNNYTYSIGDKVEEEKLPEENNETKAVEMSEDELSQLSKEELIQMLLNK